MSKTTAIFLLIAIAFSSQVVADNAARPFVHLGRGGMLTIPAPMGFCSIPDDSVLAGIYAKMDAADADNVTHVHWVKLSQDGESVVAEAWVKEPKSVMGKQLSQSDFRQIADYMESEQRKAYSGDRTNLALEKAKSALSEALAEAGETISEDTYSGGTQTFPVHRRDNSSVAFSIFISNGMEAEPVGAAVTCCMLFMKGHLLSFYI